MLFRYLNPLDKQTLQNMSRSTHYKKGDVIVQNEGWMKDLVYIIESGIVTLYGATNSPDGFVHVMYGPGEFFPVTALSIGVEDTPPSEIRAVAETDTHIYQISREAFTTFMQENTERMAILLRQVVDQFTLYAHRIESLGFMRAGERIAYLMLCLASRFSVGNNDVIEIPRVSRLTLANTVNLRKEVVSREMARLKRRGIIEYAPNIVRIIDVEKLTHQLGKGVVLPFVPGDNQK